MAPDRRSTAIRRKSSSWASATRAASTRCGRHPVGATSPTASATTRHRHFRRRIRSTRPGSPNNRGGLFATYALFTEPDLFTRYAITSPSLWWDGGSIFEREAEFAKTRRSLPKQVFVDEYHGSADSSAVPFLTPHTSHLLFSDSPSRTPAGASPSSPHACRTASSVFAASAWPARSSRGSAARSSSPRSTPPRPATCRGRSSPS